MLGLKRGVVAVAVAVVVLAVLATANDAPVADAEAASADNATAANGANGGNATFPKSFDELKVMLKAGADEMEPGLAMAYAMLIVMASIPIYMGSFRSVVHATADEPNEDIEIMTSEDAAYFPLYASGALFSLFMLFKTFGKEYVNMILGGYFFLLGTGALTTTLRPLGELLSPSSFAKEVYELVLRSISTAEAVSDNADDDKSKDDDAKPKDSDTKPNVSDVATAPEAEPYFYLKFDQVDLVCLAMSAAVGLFWIFTKHWVAINMYGLSFSITGIALFALPNFKTASMLLSGLFFYDVFWVFCTPVMVTVAKSFDAPIKVLFPKDLLEVGFMDAKEHAMLGLGDIVLPGVVVALLCRYDFDRIGKAGVYFYSTYVAYILGLIFTIVVMHTFKAAQPALLYLVPAVLLTPLTIAMVRGELTGDKGLLTYDETPEEDNQEETAADKKAK